MALSYASPVGASICIAAFIFVWRLLRFGRREKHLPPGPPTLPILGNAHQIPKTGFHEQALVWSREYGKIVSLKVGASTIIILNDRKAVHDLVDKKSAIYSGRSIDTNSLVALGDENFAFMHSTPVWRAHRKLASQNLSPQALQKVAPIQEAEICQMMHDLATSPEHFIDHLKRTTASAASIVIFGHRAPTWDSFWAHSVYDVMDLISASFEPGNALPEDQFPILKLIPDRWVASKVRAHKTFATMSTIWVESYRRAKKRWASGDMRTSFADRLLNEELKFDIPQNERQTANFLGTITQGAADTSGAMMCTSSLYLAKNPWVQKKAQAEVDRICGTHRAPVWEDFDRLPYVNCIMKESLRIQPVAPTGVPHRVKQDDWYEGMLIPKDSMIMIPPYSLHRTIYPDGDVYNPDRYLDRPRLANDYAGSPDYMNRDHYTYGAGRRICVGIHLAERTQWRMLARILWGFNILPGLDEDGNELPLPTDKEAYKTGLIHEPKPFKVRFVPRSEQHLEVIKRDFAAAEDFLKQWE